ncbi:MAG: trypsin-like peptidase domain-containing protein, partial [Candidatus Paceibacterota bacterium]
ISSDQARAVIAAKQDAIVTLRGSVKFNCGHCPQTHDEDIECVATLVDPAGFAVCGSGGKAADRKYEEQRLNFILRDGTEVPARIVLQDDDLMLTVLVPAAKPGTPLPVLSALPLKANVKAKLFDDVLAINRLDREHHNVITADTGKIAACITQPRVFYLTDVNPGGSSLGVPTFLADGRLLGVLARQTPTSTKQRRSRESVAGAGDGLHVVPAAALAELVAQARKVAAKTESK